MLRINRLQASIRTSAVRVPCSVPRHRYPHKHTNNTVKYNKTQHHCFFTTKSTSNNTLSTLLQHATSQPEQTTDILKQAYNTNPTNFNIIRNVLLQHKPLTHQQRQTIHDTLHKQYQSLSGNTEPTIKPIQIDVSQLPNEIDYEYMAEYSMIQQLYNKLNTAIFDNTIQFDHIELVDTKHIKNLKHHAGHSICPSHTHRSYLQINVHDNGNIEKTLYLNTDAIVGFKQCCEILLHDMLHLYDLQQYTVYSDTYMDGYDGHTITYFQQCMDLEEQLKSESYNYIRILRPSRPTGSLVPTGMDKTVYAELLHNMITELTLQERRKYQRTVKTGDIVHDLKTAGIEQSKIALITEPLFRPPPKEDAEQAAGQ